MLLPYHVGQYTSVYYKIGKTKTSRPYFIGSLFDENADKKSYNIYIYFNGIHTLKWLKENIKIRDKLDISEPRDRFILKNNSPKNVVCFSGGLSITPFLAMM